MADIVADSAVLSVADLPATLPTTLAALTGFAEMGKLSKDNLGIASDPTVVELFSFGFLRPTRTRKTREVMRLTANLQDWNTATVTAALNGGTITVTGGVSTFVPEDETTLVPHAMVLDIESGSYTYRFVFAECEVRSGIQVGMSDEDYSVLPLDVTILKPDSGSTYKIITNDPDWVATA